MRSGFAIAMGSGLGLALTAGCASLAGRSLERRWRSQPDPIGPEGMSLPRGEAVMVTTDDGAELSALVCDPTGPAAGGAEPPTVVLVHGWTCSRVVWAPVARRLVESGHRVVMYDLRGHGESTFGPRPAPATAALGAAPPNPSPPAAPRTDSGAGKAMTGAAIDPGPGTAAAGAGADPGAGASADGGTGMTVSRFGADVAAVLEQLDIRDAVLAGHSMGGFSVMAFASEHPELLRDRVRGLVLVATAAHGLGAGARTPFVTRVLGTGVPSRLLGRPRLGLLLLRNVVGRQPVYAHVALTRDMFVATPPHVTAACFACFAPMDLRAALAKVDLPSVVMVGSHDMLTPVALSRAIVAALPSARFELLPDAGHMLPLETPDEIAATITELAP